MPERFGEQFLHQQDSGLHTSKPVEHEKARKERKSEEASQKPAEKIADWLKLLEKTHIGHRDNPEVAERIKKYYHKEYVIKPESIPESAFLLEQRIARQLGHGNVEITQEFRERKTEQIINDQKQSLDKWIDYLTAPEADVYPTWAKYWAFASMVKMGKLEKKADEQGNENARFKKRTEDTVSAFPPINPRALAMTFGVINERAKEKVKPKNYRSPATNKSKKLSDKQFQDLLTTENFSKIYSQFLIEMPEYSKEGLQETRGKWVKYDQGSDPKPLVKSLEGHPLEWCTAGIDTARTQLEGGDFYVYYSLGKDDEPENPSIPRLAIRMEGTRIAEPPRGIAPDQHLDPFIAPVLEAKLKEFGSEGAAFKKRARDMEKLTELEAKTENKKELTRAELLFLYETDGQIEGFGHHKDPRIKELREKRNPEQDMLIIFECQESQIAHNSKEITKNTKAYVGELGSGIFELANLYNIEHIYTSFPEGRIKHFETEIGGRDKEALKRELQKAGIKTSSYTNDMIASKNFTTSENPEKVKLVRLKVRDLGFKDGATTEEIYKRADELGLELCPAEVGPNLRLKYTNQPMSEWLFIAMEQISDRSGSPHVFNLGRGEGGLWLNAPIGLSRASGGMLTVSLSFAPASFNFLIL